MKPFFSQPDLHINHIIPTWLESRGIPIEGCEIDIDGEIRDTYLPDIGADEFDGLIPSGALLAGAYSVGVHGYFSSIENIFQKLSANGIDGPITLELIDVLYTAPTDSFGFILNGPISGAGPNSRVTIKPAENKNVTIEGNGRIVISFLNTNYLTFDGVSLTGSTTLTVHASANNQFEYNLGLFFIDNSDHNIIQNGIFISDDIMRRSPSLGVSSLSYTAATPDSNLIQSNFVKKAGIGIYVSAYYSTLPATANSNIIRDNIIGSDTDTLINWGIQVERNQNAIIEDGIPFQLCGAYSSASSLNSILPHRWRHSVNLAAAPLCRVRRFALVTDFKVETALILAATAANRRNDITWPHPVTNTPVESLVVTVEAHIAIAVVDNQQKTVAAQPWQRQRAPGTRRERAVLPGCANQHPLPGE